MFPTSPQIKAENHLNDSTTLPENCQFLIFFLLIWGELWMFFFFKWFAGSLQESHLAPLAFPFGIRILPEWFHVKRWLFSPKLRCLWLPQLQFLHKHTRLTAWIFMGFERVPPWPWAVVHFQCFCQCLWPVDSMAHSLPYRP